MSVFPEPGPPPLSGPPPPSVPSRGFLVAALAGLALAALCDVFALVAGLRYHLATGEDGGLTLAAWRALDAAASRYDAAQRYQVVAFLPCAVAFIAWFHQMSRATGPLASGRFRFGTGWAVGGWFVPLANLWIPYRIAVDMWEAATPLPSEGDHHYPQIWPLKMWWALLVLSFPLGGLAKLSYDSAETMSDLRTGLELYFASDVLHLVAAGAAAYVVVRLTAMQRDKALYGPYGKRSAPSSGAAPVR
ncbi:DUF4328 domain-containing protein [Streptomyces sp. NPDC057197]|uniref:DUF4328 domain-containing protein n=1 Tax=Streptomyces sp. NPDC057197 TaxID=3346045 RepID=UPI00363AC6C4